MEYDKEGHLCNDCNQDQVAHTLNQTLWPDHCIMETSGASLAANLKTSDSDIIIRKGSNCEVSTYILLTIYLVILHTFMSIGGGFPIEIKT